MTAVVVAVLDARGGMQVDDGLEAELLRPLEHAEEVGPGTGQVGLSRAEEVGTQNPVPVATGK